MNPLAFLGAIVVVGYLVYRHVKKTRRSGLGERRDEPNDTRKRK